MEKRFKVTSKSRHIRYVFFIDEDFTLNAIKELFEKNLLKWGGRYNPIIPVVANEINESYREILKYHDPDYVMHSSSIDMEVIYSLGFTPLEYLKIDIGFENTVKGVNTNYLISTLDHSQKYIAARSLYGVGRDILSFYRVNFGLYDETVFGGRTFLHSIDLHANEFSEVNKRLTFSDVVFKSHLSFFKLDTNVLRPRKTADQDVELIISKDKGRIEDFLYYWNRQLFMEPYKGTPQIIVTETELTTLLEMEKESGVRYLFGLIFKDPSGGLRRKVTSLSLSNNELNEIIAKTLKPHLLPNSRYSFEVKNVEFPYPLIERYSYTSISSSEKPKENLFLNSTIHITENKVEFAPEITGTNDQWMVDLEISQLLEYENFQKKYCKGTNLELIGIQNSRLRKNHSITKEINSEESKIEFKVNEFKTDVKERILKPVLNGRELQTNYLRVAKSDAGKKLDALVSLFQNIDNGLDILGDKFLFDILYTLSTNTKIEGDTITFKEIHKQCVEVMASNGFSMDENGPHNIDNLGSSLKEFLQELVEQGVFKMGYNFKCDVCASKFWYSLDEVKSKIMCRGCTQSNIPIVETPISYKLNHIIKNNLATIDNKGKIHPDGNFAVFMTLYYLKGRSRSSFEYSSQLDIYSGTWPGTITGDLDILVQSDGKLIIGEVKHDSALFKNSSYKSIKSLADLAIKILPDEVVISCFVNKNEKLENAKKYLRRLLKDYPSIVVNSIKIDEASFEFEGYKYFND